ncbi:MULTISPECIES: hypothetical protein [Frankia]|uniref:Uncharacterized protein n=1 Tax=Frankia alni (strain DSM 45986 / CECT 9034 / ACN14a) TaxID=326424 RepID=Q0RML1_FRAAA|nr:MULTISPECIES: hypothetical protein [Frankia]CAJ61239.1 conserved hypothetical protein [Frankia alni ACN14a]
MFVDGTDVDLIGAANAGAIGLLQNDPICRSFRPSLEKTTREGAEKAFAALETMPIPHIEPSAVGSLALFLFLASDDAKHITGLNLRLHAGGRHQSHGKSARCSSGLLVHCPEGRPAGLGDNESS